jgi:hypothetical protein
MPNERSWHNFHAHGLRSQLAFIEPLSLHATSVVLGYEDSARWPSFARGDLLLHGEIDLVNPI